MRIRWTTLALVLAAGGLTACSGGMSEIDRDLQKALDKSSGRLGEQATAPQRSFMNEAGGDRSARDAERPGTFNPATSELRYTPAAEDRDVAARLDRFASAAVGAPTEGGPMDQGDAAGWGPAITIDLTGALRMSQHTGREFLTAQESYLLAAIRLLQERHRWGPRLFNDTTVSLVGSGTDGAYDNAVRLVNDLRATQRLPYGGEVEARWLYNASENLRSSVTDQYEQSSAIVLSGNVPLLRGAGTVAREDIISAERELVYAAREFERFRREYFVSIANEYFRLLQQQASIENLRRQLESLLRLEEQTAAEVDAGRKAAFQQNLATNDVLEAQASLAGARETYIAQLDRFKVRLGMDTSSPVVVGPLELTLPDPQSTPLEASQAALRYRLDLQNQRDRLDDSRRAVDNARNDLLPGLDVQGSVSMPTEPDAREGGLGYSPEDLIYSIGATLSLPLDRRIEKLSLRQASIRLEQQARSLEQFIDNVIVESRASVRAVELARFQLRLAEQQIQITLRRQEEQLIKADEIDTQTRLDTENALLRARNRRDQALTDLRGAILDYLLTTDQLRVGVEGILERLPGMDPAPAEDTDLIDPPETPGPAPADVVAEPLPDDGGAGPAGADPE
ncbi:MAG: TolC family protein [Phycisphaerales bacterium]|nr:TolC family protein [Phycisphaerales bacterium]